MTAALVLDSGYLEWLEKNTHILYPALAIVALVAIAIGLLQAWRTEEMRGFEKAAVKKEILHELRKSVAGSTGDELARTLGLERTKVGLLLEELIKDQILISFTNTQRLTIYRIKGAGPGR